MFGVPVRSRLPETAYNSAVSVSVYRRLEALAEAGLKSGRAVILDATFRDPKERNALQDLARRANVSFSGLWLDAPSAIRMSRVRNRVGDASDATLEVAHSQDTEEIGVVDWPKVDASQTIKAVSDAAMVLLGLERFKPNAS